MNLTNKQWIIVGVVALIVIWYYFTRKKPATESGYITLAIPGGRAMPCNCLRKLADGSTAYGRYQSDGCKFNTDCYPPKTLKDKIEIK